MNEADRIRLDKLDHHYGVLNREMGEVKGSLESIDSRFGDLHKFYARNFKIDVIARVAEIGALIIILIQLRNLL